MIDFSLVIPCFNEEGTIELILKKTKKSFIENRVELILVNNGSVDDTNNILEEIIHNYPHAKYISLRNNIGYGGGILEGLKNCKGKVIGWTHADLQTDPLDEINFFQFFKKNNINKNIFLKGND